MNDSGTDQTNAGRADQIEALRRQTFVLLLALIVIGGTLATFLHYQSHIMGKSVDSIKPQATQVIQTYNQVTATLNQATLTNFVTQITAYAIAHPDFQPVLKKYGWNPPPAPVRK